MVEQHAKALVPEIRFAGFTDPWEQRKLGEVANVCSGRDYKHLTEGPIPVYGTGGYMTSVSKALSYDEDAIGIGRKGTIDKPYRLQAPFWTVDTLFYAIPEASSDINFLLCSFLNVDWKSKDESTGLPSLSKRAINETEVLVPDNGEQRRIGAFFDRLDSLITLHQRKYDKLCVLKKSMLDKMFPKGGSLYPEIRFAGFADPWEQRKLGEELGFLRSNTLSRAELSDSEGAAFDIHYGDVLIKYGSVLDLKKAKVPRIADDAVADRQTCDCLQDGDVIIADTAEDSAVGKCTELCNSAGKKVFSGLHTMPLRPIREYASGYLGYYLNSPAFHDQLLPLMQGIKVISVSRSAMEDMMMAVPSIAEQASIGAFFDRLDSLITLHQRKLELLRNIKKSMLDKMFV
ncbi:restriction endonuclease subunit S [Bifidobacterium catenulatum]|uniref:Restriction endonuclease subunit S n=1 Tax=Bifidobacterium catenulatum PV20-2 TaxID=1447716 RepID=A0A0A7I1X5_9BIFI|nr:restriction endonuclease subunit S [Bifidobacterium catenulatum]AIZ14312.1 restriction endonuclease subunit S [Bifidobacterium catenulatum PV20-2]